MIPGDRNINPLDRIAEFICSHLDSRQLYTCLGCGTCSNLCPASGMEGVDPCALVQMVLDGKEEAVLNTPWVWHCSGCSLCLASCPEGVDVPRLVSLIRSVQDDCMLPEGLRSRLSTWISTGNLSGMYPLEYLALLDSASDVYAQRSGHKTFKLPVDKKGARVLLIVDPGLLKLRPDILPAYIHLFQAAREDWTLSSMPFGSVDMAMVSGISRHRGIWQTTFEAIVERLGPEIVVLDDCPNEMAPFGPFGNKGLEQKGVKVVGILSLVKKYLSSGQLNFGKRFGRSLTLQEPCSNTDQDLVTYCREILSGLGRFRDMVEPRHNSSCCGGSLFRLGLEKEAQCHLRVKAREIERCPTQALVCMCSTCFINMSVLENSKAIGKQVLFLPELLSSCIG